jgi:hypothetical protein
MQWILGHLPLTAAVAPMGATMVNLVAHAQDGRIPAATAWLLLAATLTDRDLACSLYWMHVRVCAVVAVVRLAVCAARPRRSPSASRSLSCLALPGIRRFAPPVRRGR